MGADNTEAAKNYLSNHNPNDINSFGVEWSRGLEGRDKRFMPYNGMIGDEQKAWFRETLEASSGSGESVVVLTHIGFHPQAVDNLCLLWNYEEILDIIHETDSAVAVLSGHDHEVLHTNIFVTKLI